MSNNSSIKECQRLLYVWMSKYENRSLDQIKISCDSLCAAKGIESFRPIWQIFWPLVYSGVIDHVGKGRYALSDPIAINFGNCCYYFNHIPSVPNKTTNYIGIYITESKVLDERVKITTCNPYSILKSFPSVDQVVDTFPTTLQDEESLHYLNRKGKKSGVAELLSEGFSRYFCIPDKLFIRAIPDRSINPDAFSISYCYDRAINGEGNGKYDKKNQLLIMPRYAMPCMLYRVLFLQCLKNGYYPEVTEDTYSFKGIPDKIIVELNRILCNSISYE